VLVVAWRAVGTCVCTGHNVLELKLPGAAPQPRRGSACGSSIFFDPCTSPLQHQTSLPPSPHTHASECLRQVATPSQLAPSDTSPCTLSSDTLYLPFKFFRPTASSSHFVSTPPRRTTSNFRPTTSARAFRRNFQTLTPLTARFRLVIFFLTDLPEDGTFRRKAKSVAFSTSQARHRELQREGQDTSVNTTPLLPVLQEERVSSGKERKKRGY